MANTEAYLTDIIKEVDELPCSHPASVNIDGRNLDYCESKIQSSKVNPRTVG